MKFRGDVDIDLPDRDKLLKFIQHIPASMRKAKPIRKHATGVHPTHIPYDPVMDAAALDYKDAEKRGYFKLDLLNVYVYSMVKNEAHLLKLMEEPDWSMLRKKTVVDSLIHLNNHYHTLSRMPEPVDSIPRLAMFLALIRPAKRHLIGRKWDAIASEVWEKDGDGDYSFKKSHSLSYAHLVVVHMNLLREQKLKEMSVTVVSGPE